MPRQSNTYDSIMKDGIFHLSRPYKYGDAQEHTDLKFPLAEMTGQHIRTAQKNYEVIEGALSGVAELNKVYQAYVAAALMGVQPDFVFGLPARDFTELTMFVQVFLIGQA